MCDVATAGLAIAAVGLVTSSYGMYQQGQAQKAQANYQAAVMRNNAIAAQQAAADARARGELAATQQDEATKKLIGRQRAIAAANGVQVDTGSAVDITSGTAGLGKLDALTIKNNAEREAIGYETQGSNFNASADLYLAKGSSAAAAGTTGAAGSLLTGFGTVAQKWYDYSKNTGGPAYAGTFTQAGNTMIAGAPE